MAEALTSGEDEFYRGVSRAVARRLHPDLAEATADLAENSLGGLARTLVGLLADGADPRRTVCIELVDEPFQGSILNRIDEPTRFEHQTNDFTVRGDGTEDGEEVTLSFRADTLEQI